MKGVSWLRQFESLTSRSQMLYNKPKSEACSNQFRENMEAVVPHLDFT